MNRTGAIRIISALWGLVFTLPAIAADPGGSLPEGFVYLRDVAPSIRQDIRYAGPDNFTGRPVPGYEAPECILAKPAANALKSVQADLAPQSLSLKVYDCYRPKQAVAAFVAWAKAPDDPEAKRAYYPNLSKGALFPNYIATRSGHSRGATVDVTLVADQGPQDTGQSGEVTACTMGGSGDESLDMGTRFDCFDTKANTAAPGLTETQRRNRKTLVKAMARHGFKNYPNEFWHYTFKPEPYPKTYFDFPILPRASGKEQR